MAELKTTEILREWAPLTDLFNKLPTKVQSGFFFIDVKITCLDILPEFIALGTNVGIVYWYDRKKRNLERLRCEKSNVPIVVVKAISTVDFMVACGNEQGNISIFQIPKSHPDSIPENLKPKNKQVERYTVSDLHKSPVTALEWSTNGMKLFSGDKNGCIVLTEIDFYMHICKSVEILNETYQVVQLNYRKQKLLVSTTYRSIICQQMDKWKINQVGKKDRKILGTFGGIIYQNSVKPQDTILYCTRPGLRIWVADCDGNVQKTLLFKELLFKECTEVPIINPISDKIKRLKPQKEPSFGILLPFGENLLLTYNNDIIYILDPEQMTVLYTMSQFRSVLGVATCKKEIFILEEERSVVRVAFNAETFTALESPSMTSSLKEFTQKIPTANIIPAMLPHIESTSDFNIHTDDTLIMNAEEATESPRRSLKDPEIEKIFNDIGKQEFNDEILFKQKKKKRNPIFTSTSSISSNSSEERDVVSLTKPTLMNLSAVGVLPDLRSPESIQSDIEYKEKILENVLNLDKINIDLNKLKEPSAEQPYENKDNSTSDTLGETSSDEPIIMQERKQKSNSGICKRSQKSNIPPAKPPNTIESPPACISIPTDWKLGTINMNTVEEPSENSFTDWEII